MPDTLQIVNDNSYSKIIFSNLDTFISLIIFLVNLLVTIALHFYLFNRRRKNEREYQSRVKFYEYFVLSNSASIFDFYKYVKNEYKSLHPKFSFICEDDILERIRLSIDRIVEENDKLEIKINSAFSFYNEEFFRDIEKKLEEFSDYYTQAIVEIKNISSGYKGQKQYTEFNIRVEENLRALTAIIKKYHPKP